MNGLGWILFAGARKGDAAFERKALGYVPFLRNGLEEVSEFTACFEVFAFC